MRFLNFGGQKINFYRHIILFYIPQQKLSSNCQYNDINDHLFNIAVMSSYCVCMWEAKNSQIFLSSNCLPQNFLLVLFLYPPYFRKNIIFPPTFHKLLWKLLPHMFTLLTYPSILFTPLPASFIMVMGVWWNGDGVGDYSPFLEKVSIHLNGQLGRSKYLHQHTVFQKKGIQRTD